MGSSIQAKAATAWPAEGGRRKRAREATGQLRLHRKGLPTLTSATPGHDVLPAATHRQPHRSLRNTSTCTHDMLTSLQSSQTFDMKSRSLPHMSQAWQRQRSHAWALRDLVHLGASW